MDLTRHLARRRASDFLDVRTARRAWSPTTLGGVREESSDDSPMPHAERGPGPGPLSTGWNRKHSCRFAEHDVQVMHSDTNRGIEVLLNPIYNKGTGFSIAEKERLGIRGLTPPRYFSIEQQCDKIWESMNEPGKTAMFKWRSMQALQDRNETLFYRLLVEHIEELAPIIYTPTVGEACMQYSRLFRRPRGMYFSADDRGHFNAMMYNWKSDVNVIVVTDGSRVLGLGDLGAQGMGISVGKLDLYVAGAGIEPSKVLPCVLDVGTDNQDLLDDPYYFGVHRKRLTGDEYYDVVDEFIQAVKNRWPNALVQFEDFQTEHAMPILKRHRDNVLCFNDDIQGTAVVVLAGVYGAMAALGKDPSDITKQTFVMCGAGSAGMGIANFLHTAMVHHGLTDEEAHARFFIVDKDGLVTDKRKLDKNAPGVEELRAFAEARKAGVEDSSKDSSKDELLAQKLTRVAYVEDQMRKFAATNPKAGADVERVVRQKTKDKVVLLDAANAFAESDKHKKKDSNARSRQDASIPSEARLRTIGVRGALQNSQAVYANFAPMRDTFRDYVNETMRGLGDDDSVDDTRLQYEAQRKISEKNLNEIRGAVVSVSASRNSSLVGRKGVVARATATSIFLVTENNSIVAVPRKGSLFNLDLTLGKMKRNCKVIVKGEDACV